MAGRRVRVPRESQTSNSGKSELDETIKAIRKRFGDNTVTNASEILQPSRISTGVFILDLQTMGGIPTNRGTMIIGEKHAGKTMLACKIVANAQQQYPDKKVVYIDIEGTFDEIWARKLGVNTDELILVQPETGESAVDIADALVGTEEVCAVVIDSIAALTPMAESSSSAEDAMVGVQARLVGRMIRKTTQSMINERKRGHEVALLFLNQFRAKIGGFSGGFGEPLSVPGGKALEFATTIQITIRNKENTGKNEEGHEMVVLNEHNYRITKNKLNSGARTGEFRVLRCNNTDYGLNEGDVDDASTLLAYAKKFDAYTGGGSSWKLAFWDHDLSFRKMDDAVRYLYEHRDVYWDLRNFLIASYAESMNMPDHFVQRFLDD
jgi:recombination protein RecA